MAEIVVLTVDGSGNVPPALAIASELVGRGHHVRVLGHARQKEDVVGRGLDFTAYTSAFAWSGQDHRGPTKAALDFVRLVGDRGVGGDLTRAHASRGVDAVLVDAMIPGALIEARRLGVPAATLMHTFASFFLSPAMEIAGLVRGFSPRAQWASSRTLVASDRLLDPGAAHRRAARYTWTGVAEPGPAAPAPPRAPLGTSAPDEAGSASPPLVLVSLSSVYIPAQRGMFERILHGLAGLPVRVLVTTGPTVDPATLPAWENTEVRRYVPHAQVMPLVALVVGHGGHSTTMRALMHGLPLLVLPADPRIDQAMVGRAVAEAGAGICLPRSSGPEAVKSAVAEILGAPRYAEAAAAIGQRLRSARGVSVAADHVEAIAGGETP